MGGSNGTKTGTLVNRMALMFRWIWLSNIKILTLQSKAIIMEQKTNKMIIKAIINFSDMEHNNKPTTPNSNYTLEPITHQYDINR